MEINDLLLKFGKKEHIEELANGNMFFNQVKSYREDTTQSRGDSDEGCIPINPQNIKIIDSDGNNLLDRISLPDKVRSFRQKDESTLMFCGTEISKNILTKRNNKYFFTKEYIESIKSFGDYVLLFSKKETLNKLYIESEKESSEFGYIADSINYENLNNFSYIDKQYNLNKSVYAPFLKKDISYKTQSEYRIIIDGITKQLELNLYGGYIINLGKFEWAHIFETKTFLNDFYIIEDE